MLTMRWKAQFIFLLAFCCTAYVESLLTAALCACDLLSLICNALLTTLTFPVLKAVS